MRGRLPKARWCLPHQRAFAIRGKTVAALYETPGKQVFRELVRSVATSDGLRTFGTFWGTGIDSALMTAAGFDVIACEIVQAKHAVLSAHAEEHGYRAWLGRAGRLTERREMFHADFDGGPSPHNFRELRRIAAITDRWMAVTISLDHLRDASIMGEAAFYTIPAWLTGATGMTLEYLGRYTRNRLGQVMWTALLQRKTGKGTSHQVLPMQIAYSISQRAYWSSQSFYTCGLLPHRYAPKSEHEKAAAATYYVANRDHKLDQAKRAYERRKQDPDLIAADRTRYSVWRRSEAGRAWHRGWVARRKLQDPEWAERKRQYHREWYLRKKALAVQSTASEAPQVA